MTGICKIDSNETVNVNVLTHLERARVEYLYNIKRLTFDSAKAQAVTEVLKAFGYTNTGIKRAEKVGVVGIGDGSKILLAISTLMQGYRTESEVTQIMNDFANDLKKDGILDDVTIGNDLTTHLYYVDTAAVLSNFKVKYRKLYNADTVNSVDMRFVKNFQNNTTFVKDKELIDYPIQSTGLYGTAANIFRKDVTAFTGTRPYQSVNVTRKGLYVKIEAYKSDGTKLSNGVFSACAGCNSNWAYDQRYDGTTNTIIPTWTSTGQLSHLDMGGFSAGSYLIKYFEGPNTNKLSFSKTGAILSIGIQPIIPIKESLSFSVITQLIALFSSL